MINFYPKTHFLTSDSVIKYVSNVLRYNAIITEYEEFGEEYDEDGKYIEGNWHLERHFKMVPKHFHFKIIDDDWDDKMYRFSFLTDDNRMLCFDEDKPYHKKIESLCWDAPKKIHVFDLKSKLIPSDMQPSPWTNKDMGMIYNRVNNPIVIRQNPKPGRQR